MKHTETVNHGFAVSRRAFIGGCLKTIAGVSLGVELLNSTSLYAGVMEATHVAQNDNQHKTFVAPLFCTAYITPDAPGQGGQEAVVARYPMALVPQDNSPVYRKWRDKIKTINPKIVLLGYQMVIQETRVPGPGHDKLRNARNAWSVYPGGVAPRIFDGSMREGSRIYDPRNASWRTAFLEACRATLASYPYDGLFLDMCDVVVKAHPFPWVRTEMRAALQETLRSLRNEFPSAILVGNSSQSYAGLNGEMDERRPSDMAAEFAPFAGHASPRVELYQSRLRRADDFETVAREMAMAHSYGAFYGAAVDYQHVLWFDAFDRVLTAYNGK